MGKEWRVTITADDLDFLQRAKQHYELFACVAKEQTEETTFGIFEAQKFHCEQFLLRIGAAQTIGSKK